MVLYVGLVIMVSSLRESDRAQMKGLTGLMIGVLISAIVGVQVVIPVVNDAIASANVTGTTGTVLGLVPLFVGLLILVGVAQPLMGRF